MGLRKCKNHWSLVLLIFSLLLMTGCTSKNEEKLTQGTIIQIVSHRDSLQENAIYDFNQGKVDVSMTYSPFQGLNTQPDDIAYKETVENDMERYRQEFPKETINFEIMSNHFEKTFDSVEFIKDTNRKKIYLKGSTINKSFTMSETNENRLIDEVGIEYEFVEESI